jgi:Acyl-CoA dehydrogenase, C-terminal domain
MSPSRGPAARSDRGARGGSWRSRTPRPRSVKVSSRVFEVAGTRAVLESLNLNRHWRNARTHTLHDRAAWKVQHLGRHALEGVLPPNHGQI